MEGVKVQRIHCVFCSVIYNKGEMFTHNVIYCETQGSVCSQSLYNDVVLCDTSYMTSDNLWYQLIPHC